MLCPPEMFVVPSVNDRHAGYGDCAILYVICDEICSMFKRGSLGDTLWTQRHDSSQPGYHDYTQPVEYPK